mmetsp:Transcript_127807/g.361771  ORF Transcript_127807/g.361771 Transcript_127807/m.361771 type:complete len:287 (-) Transcript_127807:851-1711(-)
MTTLCLSPSPSTEPLRAWNASFSRESAAGEQARSIDRSLEVMAMRAEARDISVCFGDPVPGSSWAVHTKLTTMIANIAAGFTASSIVVSPVVMQVTASRHSENCARILLIFTLYPTHKVVFAMPVSNSERSATTAQAVSARALNSTAQLMRFFFRPQLKIWSSRSAGSTYGAAALIAEMTGAIPACSLSTMASSASSFSPSPKAISAYSPSTVPMNSSSFSEPRCQWRSSSFVARTGRTTTVMTAPMPHPTMMLTVLSQAPVSFVSWSFQVLSVTSTKVSRKTTKA